MRRLIYCCQLFGVAQVVALSLGVKNGIGRRMQALTPQEQDNMDKVGQNTLHAHLRPLLTCDEQSIYAFNLLYILSLCFAKLSIVYLLKRLTTKATHRHYIHCLEGLTLSWATAAFLSIAFQCGKRHPWSQDRRGCIYLVSFHSNFMPVWV